MLADIWSNVSKVFNIAYNPQYFSYAFFKRITKKICFFQIEGIEDLKYENILTENNLLSQFEKDQLDYR